MLLFLKSNKFKSEKEKGYNTYCAFYKKPLDFLKKSIILTLPILIMIIIIG